MNEKKFAFIICVNNEILFEECQYYINRLNVPDGYEIDMIVIREAGSMCVGYNAGMQSSDAKYKIYLHQDVLIRNVDFLQEILDIFVKDESIGMIGVLGGNGMPKTGMAYMAWDCGMVDCRDPDMAYYLEYDREDFKDAKADASYAQVEAIDGILMATQYDVPWREDLLSHFDFYDVSQSFEMRKAGYRIVVPYQKEPWVIHDSNFVKLTHYDEGRQACLSEYPEYFYAEGGMEFSCNYEWNALSEELIKVVKGMLSRGEWEQVASVIELYRQKQMRASELETICIMHEIYRKELENGVDKGFFDECYDWKEMYEKYMYVRFLLRRIELGMSEREYEDLVHEIKAGTVSCDAIITLVVYSVVNKSLVLEKCIEYFKQSAQTKCMDRISAVYQKIKEKGVSCLKTTGKRF